jgi:hypothetical protein
MCALMVNISPAASAERMDASTTMALVNNKDGGSTEEIPPSHDRSVFFADVDRTGN